MTSSIALLTFVLTFTSTFTSPFACSTYEFTFAMGTYTTTTANRAGSSEQAPDFASPLATCTLTCLFAAPAILTSAFTLITNTITTAVLTFT